MWHIVENQGGQNITMWNVQMDWVIGRSAIAPDIDSSAGCKCPLPSLGAIAATYIPSSMIIGHEKEQARLSVSTRKRHCVSIAGRRTNEGDVDGSGLELATHLANLLQQNGNLQPLNPKLSDNLQISIKLNSQNYALWSRMIRVAIGGKSKILLNHLTKTPPEHLTTEKYEAWEQEYLIVFSWLIQNIEPNIAGNLTKYPTAKALWDALVVTYNSGKDKLQTFNLHVKANELKQGDKSLEFLNGLDRKFKPIKREILRVDPLPTVEAAYATVRKEAAYATRNRQHGLVNKGFSRFDGKKKPATRNDKSHLKCEECGMNRHTKDQFFEIIGYPDWWTDGHKTTSNKGAKKDKPSTSPTTNTRKSTKNSNDRRSEGGFGGVVAAVREEGEESFSVKGRDGLLGVVLKEMDYTMLMSGQGEEQGDPLSWLSYTSAATIGNEIQNHSTTSAEAPNISATLKYHILDMISEALKLEKWKNAMDDEMKALKKNETWDQCALPQGKSHGKNGYNKGPVSLASNQRWSLHQFDAKNAFLHGELKEEVYMEAPPGFSEYFKPGKASLRIVKYLKGTTGHGVLFRSNRHLNIQMYTDADWAGDKGIRRSTSGYFSLVGGNLVTWRSKKQKVVSLSSAKAEFRGIAKGLAEALWIRKLVSRIGFPPRGST
uniref:Reverse transcriptase Ty1/copia-type domain-containing protein n=1 Tax=Tanacetum cinerariifolium TaxID=118510 RepID=A0A6L2MMU9_TANCI|nr:hypothetical protein [Tanacetum cinerariifolium]